MTLEKMLNEEDKAKKRIEMSVNEPGIRSKLREEIYDEMPGEDLQPHALKMQLRPEEEDALELVSKCS